VDRAKPDAASPVQSGMNKTTKSLFLVVAAGSLALSVAAHADENSPVDPGHPRVTEVQKRQENQQDRIGKGVENGSLTPGEAARLERQEGRIEKHKAADMAAHDGHLTKPEQRRLNRQENRESKRIYHAKHNAKTVGTPGTTPPAAPATQTK
jgi:hypothetical protein